MMFTRCAKCSAAIDMSDEGRLPASCPRCGANLGQNPGTTHASAARMPERLCTSGNSDPSQTEALDETRLFAVHEFSLRGYLNGKAGAGLLLVFIFLGIAGLAFGVALMRPGSGMIAPGLIMLGLAAAFLVYTFISYPKRIRRVEVFADGIRW